MYYCRDTPDWERHSEHGSWFDKGDKRNRAGTPFARAACYARRAGQPYLELAKRAYAAGGPAWLGWFCAFTGIPQDWVEAGRF
jgi:hypothetical protein